MHNVKQYLSLDIFETAKITKSSASGIIMSDPDELFTLRTLFWLGSFQVTLIS
jgi:hypothetical protein